VIELNYFGYTFGLMSGKRIVVTTATPNDQGGVIPDEALDFSRFKLNPVVLCQHIWGAPPIGMWSDWKLNAPGYPGWSMVPEFHGLEETSKLYGAMYEGGWIRACSIGGEAEWKTNTAGQLVYDANGNKICEKFVLYEVSIVTLPSNHEAVVPPEAYAAKIYDKSEIQQVHNSIVTLSSKYKSPIMEPKDKDKTPQELKLAAAQKALDEAKAEKEAADKIALQAGGAAPTTDPSISQNPDVTKQILSFSEKVISLFHGLIGMKTEKVKNEGAPTPKDTPESHISDPTVEQPTPIGLSAEQAAAKKKADEAMAAAEQAMNAANSAKEKADKEGASDEDKDDFAAKYAAAEKACNEAEQAAAAFKSAMESDDMDMNGAKKKTTNAAAGGTGKPGGKANTPPAPKLKTMDELNAEKLKLAPKPEIKVKLGKFNGVPFTALSAKGNEEGNRIINRVMCSDGGGKEISDYAVVLESLMTDGRYKAIMEKTRVINTSPGQFESYRKEKGIEQVKNRAGMDMRMLAAQLASGSVEVLGRDGVLRGMTALTSTDNALAAPALNTIEWLSLAIFTLFPSSDWKADIPMFGAQMTSSNTGLIWANVAADPAIYFGDRPVNPADYTQDDDAVALTLFNSWLQPMRWTPLTMHQLRYDQMSVQWAQAFAKWGAAIDDKLIYTLASTVPASSIIYTIGQGGVGGTKQFDLTGANDPNAFAYNPNLVASLAAPAWADIIRIEQIYAKQNFVLDREKIVLVTDPTMDRYIDTDPDTKSLLTRFTQTNPEDLIKIKHTTLRGRSKIAAFDPASGQVKDPAGALPADTISAGVGFIPSQVGMGLGVLDVFMIQDPTAYGYRMSADIREGIVPVRKNYNGTILYTYGAPVNP
jgi:hypothetical protein